MATGKSAEVSGFAALITSVQAPSRYQPVNVISSISFVSGVAVMSAMPPLAVKTWTAGLASPAKRVTFRTTSVFPAAAAGVRFCTAPRVNPPNGRAAPKASVIGAFVVVPLPICVRRCQTSSAPGSL